MWDFTYSDTYSDTDEYKYTIGNSYEDSNTYT
jgi:hypothetical protein